jgi:ubiquinone/menaquinone biosynthesis C-methylase UbiE
MNRSDGGDAVSAAVDGDAPMRTWRDVWRARSVDVSDRPQLSDLIRADGFDNSFSALTEESWQSNVRRWMDFLRVRPGMTVYEVGCGAGAFLYGFHQRGCRVGGLDLSEDLIRIARKVMPDGAFSVGDAAGLSGEASADVVVASGVFIYFPTPSYARQVLHLMARSARHAVLILDLPDSEMAEAARASRMAALGPEEYSTRYSGLEHQYYGREEMRAALSAQNFSPVGTEDVQIEGYANGAFRFDLYGFKVGTPW